MRTKTLNQIEKVNLPLALMALWLAAATVLTSHFRFYYDVDWQNAIKWGMGDGAVWALLSGVFVSGYRLFLLDFHSWPMKALFLGLAVLGGVILHPTLVTLLYWVIDGSIGSPFFEDVFHLIMKRMPQGILAGLVIGFAGISLARYSSSAHQKGGSIENARTTQAPATPWLILQGAKGVRRIDIRDIQYIEAAGNYVSLYASNGEHLERSTLKSMCVKLSGQGFLRISRKHVVNVSRVQAIEPKKPKGDIVILDGGVVLPVSRQYKIGLEEAFANGKQTLKTDKA